MQKPGKRYPLLLYARLFAMLRWPSFLIAGLCGTLWWFALTIPLLSSDLAQTALLTAAGCCGVLFLYTLIGPQLAYVQCYPNCLRINTPLYRVVISYNRIQTVRPVPFTPARMGWSQRRFLEPFLGQTIVAVDLNGYPVHEKWLRLWLNPFMFPTNFTGLLFHARDWMALSRDIDEYRSHWKTRRTDRSAASVANPFASRRDS